MTGLNLTRNRRLGIMHLRIAAIVIANHVTLVAFNLRDFAVIDDLRVEAWTAE
jgi:predicted nucleic acid-binding protein